MLRQQKLEKNRVADPYDHCRQNVQLLLSTSCSTIRGFVQDWPVSERIRTSSSCLRGHILWSSRDQYLSSILLPLWLLGGHLNFNATSSLFITGLVLFVLPKLTVSGQHRSRLIEKVNCGLHSQMMIAACSGEAVVRRDMWSTTRNEAGSN